MIAVEHLLSSQMMMMPEKLLELVVIVALGAVVVALDLVLLVMLNFVVL